MRTLWIFSFLIAILPASGQTGLTNELIWKGGEFSADYFEGLNSMKDGMHYTSIEQSDAFGDQIVKYSYSTGERVSIIASAKDIFGSADRSIEGYTFSQDESMILIETEHEPIYRWSASAHYFVYHTDTKKTIPLTDFKLGKQRLAEFSPNGKFVAFVRANNLFITDLTLKKEIQVTDDGEWNKIINGSTDWVYEEEFTLSKGFEWSPAGDRIAYYRFDESAVREYGMDVYGDLYPGRTTFKYPKAGEQNSTVGIYLYDLNTRLIRKVNTGTDPETYIPRIKWTRSNDKLCVMRMNRHQNHLELLLTDLSQTEPFDVSTSVIYDETAETYIDVTDNLYFPADGKSFFWTSERDNYHHIWQFNFRGEPVRQITSGPWDVIDFYGMDEQKGLIFYSSSEISPVEKHVYSVDIRKSKRTKMSPLKGTNDADFSTGMKFFILTHSDAATPERVTLHNSKGEEIRMLKDNKALSNRLIKYKLTRKEFFQFSNRTGDNLNCWMMKPANFDPQKKYPVLVTIYGGPGSNTVADSWGGRSHLWHQLLCQEGYIVVSCDPRGTQYRGRAFKHSTYMNLGKLETLDFIDLAVYLGSQDYIDAARIGMQGWSYGGYMTSLCMTKGAEYYSAGIAVAPVTNWKYYDSIYTERFMRTPQENEGGYENNSPINFAENLKGKFLLVHGSADDNVHFQNTMDMVSALVDKNKDFEMFVYPNKNHGIYGGNTRLHLFSKMTGFILKNL